MKTAEFILLLTARKNNIIYDEQLLRTPWWFRWYVNDLTEGIEYGCKFDADGVCETKQALNEKSLAYRQKCCCAGCAASVGHNSIFPGHGLKDHGSPDLVDDVLEVIARKYNIDDGFWERGRGCILPRRYRSKMCLAYKCSESGDYYDNYLIELLHSFDREFNIYTQVVASGKHPYMHRQNKDGIEKFTQWRAKIWAGKAKPHVVEEAKEMIKLTREVESGEP